jgi:membrane-associated phospholipid phosphatase
VRGEVTGRRLHAPAPGRPGNLVVLAAAVVGVWVTLDVLLDGPLRALDHRFSAWMLATGIRDSEWPQPLFAAKFVAYAVTHLGQREAMLVVSLLGVGAAARLARSWRPVARLGVLLVLLAGTVYLAKHAVGRAMPAVDGLHLPAGRSFPSGHLATAITLWGLLGWLAAEQPADRGPLLSFALWWLGVLRWLAPALTFVTLALLDYHWLTDLVAGAAIGVLLLRVGYEIDARLGHLPGGRRGGAGDARGERAGGLDSGRGAG